MKKDSIIFLALVGILLGLSQTFVFLLPVVIFAYFKFLKNILRENSIKRSVFKGWIFGVGFFLGSMHWIISPFLIFERHFAISPISIFFPLLMGLFFCIPAFFLAITNKFSSCFRKNHIFFQSWIMGTFFIFPELLRSFIWGGLPFNLTAHIWAFNEEFIQISKFIGVFGLSFLTLVWIGFLSFCIMRNEKWKLLFATFFFPVFLFSFNFVSKEKFENGHEIFTRVVQPNISQKEKWNKLLFQRNFEKLLSLTIKKNSSKKEKIIIWPEVALTFYLNEEKDLIAYLRKKIPDNTTIVTGGLRRVFSNKNFKVYNTLYVIDKENFTFYDKKKLVPFGEFMPLRGFLNLFKLTPGSTDFEKGEQENQIRIIYEESEIFFEPSICYEAIFQTFGAEESSIMINITNDAWFGYTTGPRQHLAAQIFRSVEKSVFFLRSANSGISVALDSSGKILKRIELGDEGYFDLKIKPLISTTPFEKYGNLLLFLSIISLCLLFCLIEFLFSLKRKH